MTPALHMVFADGSPPGDLASAAMPALVAQIDLRRAHPCLDRRRPVSLAEDEVKVSPAQMQSLGVHVTHPVSSRSDQTLPYPAQIVIPTPQLWVVSAPVAGMVTSLSVARGDRVTPGQRLSPWRARVSCRCSATICMPPRRTSLPRSSCGETPSCSKARRCRSAWWRPARRKPGSASCGIWRGRRLFHRSFAPIIGPVAVNLDFNQARML